MGKKGKNFALDVLFYDLRRLLSCKAKLIATFAPRNYMKKRRILIFVL